MSAPSSRWKAAVSKVQEEKNVGAIKVCVRLRPFNKKEMGMSEEQCVEMPTDCDVILTEAPGQTKSFTFDRAYWSFDPANESKFATQETLMQEIGNELVSNSLAGYNCCLFAYGQTGAGKTYSIQGGNSRSEQGLLPRIIDRIFDDMQAEAADPVSPVAFACSATYMEIYNEQVIDLLRPPNRRSAVLSVRRNPQVGVYVEGLQNVPVFEKKDLRDLLNFGIKARTVGETCMNAQSSRSHCIFTMETRRKKKTHGGTVTETTSRLNIVDLAGSERQGKTQASGSRLKEGAAINKSLSTLALVIAKLAELGGDPKRNADFVPFRNSKLTFVLQDSLSGNSKTVMIAALSPAFSNHDENLSTLRFAQSVKKVKTKASKNEAKEGAMLENLKAEVERLRAELLNSKGSSEEQIAREELRAAEDLAQRYARDLEQQLEEAKSFSSSRKRALMDMGLELDEITEAMGMQMSSAHLVNLDYDPSLTGSLIYFVPKNGRIVVGSGPECHAKFMGLGTFSKMATLSCDQDFNVRIMPLEGRILVNGRRINEAQNLYHGDRVIFGYASCFYLVIPGHEDDEGTSMPGLDSALAEIMPEQTEAYEKCYWYIEQLQNRLGTTRAQLFTKQFRKTALMVEEANAITEEIRPMDRLEFAVEVMVDMFKYQEEVPQCVVRLKKWDTGANRFRKQAQKVINNFSTTRQHVAFLEKQFRMSFMDTPWEDGFETIVILNIEKLKLRVHHLREVYVNFCRQGRQPLRFTLPEYDPWCEIPTWEVEPMIRSRVDSILQAYESGNYDPRVWERISWDSNAAPLPSTMPPWMMEAEGCGVVHDRMDGSGAKKTTNSNDRRQGKHEPMKVTGARMQEALEIVEAARGELRGREAKVQELEASLRDKDGIIVVIQEMAQVAQMQLHSVKSIARRTTPRSRKGLIARHAPRWCVLPLLHSLRRFLAIVQ